MTVVRSIRIEGDLAFIPLSQGLEAVIDAADVHLVEGRNWHAVLNKNVRYARACGRTGESKRRMVPLHRVLLVPPSGMLVDHVDGDGLNCRRSNLRLATISENGRNQRLSKANTSGRKGVSWDRGKWCVKIKAAGKVINLGRFCDLDEAAAVYAEASRKYHGEFGLVPTPEIPRRTTMTPDERAAAVLAEFSAATDPATSKNHPVWEPAKLIAAAIRAAENDALDKAIVCITDNVIEPVGHYAVEAIKHLKHPTKD